MNVLRRPERAAVRAFGPSFPIRETSPMSTATLTGVSALLDTMAKGVAKPAKKRDERLNIDAPQLADLITQYDDAEREMKKFKSLMATIEQQIIAEAGPKRLAV